MPILKKKIGDLKDRCSELEREADIQGVENRILQNKLKVVSEDYTTMKLAQMAIHGNSAAEEKKTPKKRGGFFSNDNVELIKEN